jgi:maltose alpha-D-glucosyltransferase / alpha-amylase
MPSLWYKNSIIYALHIRSFCDSDGDGIGDILGLIQKLDYLEELGIDAILLMPFYPSPQRDDGYDITNHQDIHPDYGNLNQFESLIQEAHLRGIKIVIDLVLNHTSTQHPWFQRARLAPPDSPHRNFYLWSHNTASLAGASILFPDFESSNWEWDHSAQAYYFHRFHKHQADLNYDNPHVQQEIFNLFNFWFQLGVDGCRLTSLAYLFKREGTNSENLPEVHQFILNLRQFVDNHHPGKILIADTNLWPEQAAQFLDQQNKCHLNYNYALMPRLYLALQTEDRYHIMDIINQTPPIHDTSQWALFLRNHDDLSLSMVTDEERVFLLKALALDQHARINVGIRRRLAPLLGNDRRKIELLYVLLFSLPGTPILYYGDEIGMGDNIYLADRNGLRTPMQWNDDRNAGFSSANPQQLFLPIISDPAYRYEAVNVKSQRLQPNSLLSWIKNAIATRKRNSAFSFGSLEFINAGNPKILAFLRAHDNQTVLTIVNLSRFSQSGQLNLADFNTITPIEIFSNSPFVPISTEPYTVTLGPYGYFWLQLDNQLPTTASASQATQILPLPSPWHTLLEHYSIKKQLEKSYLPPYISAKRWFAGKAKTLLNVEIINHTPISTPNGVALMCILQVRYTQGLPESYFLPISCLSHANDSLAPEAIIAHTSAGLLIDALFDDHFRNSLFSNIQAGISINQPGVSIIFEPGVLSLPTHQISSTLLHAEQSNTSVIYNDAFFFKVFRKPDTDLNPDLEIVRFLSEQSSFNHSPQYGGSIFLSDRNSQSVTILGLLQNKINNTGDAWTLILNILQSYYRVVPAFAEWGLLAIDHPAFLKAFGAEAEQLIALLAIRTAEMHIALASNDQLPDFSPQPFTLHYQRSLYTAWRKLVHEKLDALQTACHNLPEATAADALRVLNRKDDILSIFKQIYATPINTQKIRIHGDYHLGQVLFDGQDFFIIDFEGEPMLSISERRLKRSPFKDVAGMLRSFHYAAFGKLILDGHDNNVLEQYAQIWYDHASQIFLKAYLDKVKDQRFLPDNPNHTRLLITVYTLEKAIYEVGYEMNARPDWLRIPLRGLL